MLKPDEQKAYHIFDKWKADLKEMNRTKANVDGNFDVLFSNLKHSKISFELAHEILDKAIKAHQPAQPVVDNVYKRLGGSTLGKSKQEFADEWKENISAAGKRMFYSLYDIDGVEKEESKEYGSMSAKEYRLQRKHIESAPLIDWKSIVREPISLDDLKEMENMLKNVGGKDE